MKRPPRTAAELSQDLRTAALRYPEAQDGIACEGTSAEKRTVKARNKAFLFLGPADAMLKLGDSISKATDLASKEPDRWKVGAHGWITVIFGNVESLPVDLLVEWIDESYRLLAPRPLIALLPERGPPSGDAPPTAMTPRKKPSRKKGPTETTGENRR